MKFLRINKKLCTGCRICETACSVAKEGVINRAFSRIRIYRVDVTKLSYKVCVQCKKPACIPACPTEAIYVGDEGIRIRENLCDGCGECVKVCDRLFMSPDGKRALMCDQCGACVPECPEGALSIR